jgi:hypothetical protein
LLQKVVMKHSLQNITSGPTAIDFLRDEVRKAKPFTHGGLNQLPYMFFDAVAQAMENYLAACTTAKGGSAEEKVPSPQRN